MKNMLRRGIAALLLSCAAEANATPEFLLEPSGQATGSSCQSYALAVALAFKRDAAFPVQTASDLRKVETGIRSKIKQAAGSADVTHVHVKAGFDAYTSGRYKLTIKPGELAAVGNAVAARSGVSSEQATPPTFLLGAVVKDVLLASATRIGKDSYGGGHIFTILGATLPANSSQKFLILNSGVKVKGENTARKACSDGVPDKLDPYVAMLGWTKSVDIEFKQASGKVLLWTID
ncbi:hypothetical protein QTI24_21565 [Variovorax sp. J22P240]|uniref:hypothetical protein n=1 Tax=Variovorax sp. J22P240 TaxID=3053514 RepID=UPI002575F18A|nr:hypothetical protein [Variovorax sp. J22P240]MDM0001209.1 hypothetical protein [Variovorax sp. J22P240]